LLDGNATDSYDLLSELLEAVQVLADFALRQHPPEPTGPEEFAGVELISRDVGTALSRCIIKTHLDARNRHYPKHIKQGGQTCVSSGLDAEHDHHRGRLSGV